MLGEFIGQDEAITQVAFNKAGTMLATAGADGTARVFDVRDDDLRMVAQFEERGGLLCCRFIREFNAIVAATSKGVVCVWAVEKSSLQRKITLSAPKTLRSREQ